MNNALQERLAGLRAFQTVVNEITEEAPVDSFEKVRQEYREAHERVDLYGEALAARPYVAALERKVAELESRLRSQSKPHTW